MSLLKHKIICEDDSVYYGYVNSEKEPEGEGTLTYTNGNVLEAMWHKGSPNGPGVLRKSRKDTSHYLEVNFEDGYMQGKFIYHFGGNICEGTIKDGCFDDDGNLQGVDYAKAVLKEYDSYTGGYDVYRGGIDRYFNKYGKGTIHFSDGFTLSGTWKETGENENGRPVTAMSGHGKLVSPKGTVIEGMFRDNNPRGRAVIRFDDKTGKYGKQVFTGIMTENGLTSPDFSRCSIGSALEDDHPYIQGLYAKFRELVMWHGNPENMRLDVAWDGGLRTVSVLEGSFLMTSTGGTKLMDVTVDPYHGTGMFVTSNGKQYYEMNPDGEGRWVVKETDHKYFSEQLIVKAGEGRYAVYSGTLFAPWEKIRSYAVRQSDFRTVVYEADNMRLVPKKDSRYPK